MKITKLGMYSLAVGAFAMAITGCGGKKEESTDNTAPAAGAPAGKMVDPATAGEVTGSVKLDGAAPNELMTAPDDLSVRIRADLWVQAHIAEMARTATVEQAKGLHDRIDQDWRTASSADDSFPQPSASTTLASPTSCPCRRLPGPRPATIRRRASSTWRRNIPSASPSISASQSTQPGRI